MTRHVTLLSLVCAVLMIGCSAIKTSGDVGKAEAGKPAATNPYAGQTETATNYVAGGSLRSFEMAGLSSGGVAVLARVGREVLFYDGPASQARLVGVGRDVGRLKLGVTPDDRHCLVIRSKDDADVMMDCRPAAERLDRAKLGVVTGDIIPPLSTGYQHESHAVEVQIELKDGTKYRLEGYDAAKGSGLFFRKNGTLESIPSTGIIEAVDLVVDAAGAPHIVDLRRKGSARELVYTARAGDAWTSTKIDGGFSLPETFHVAVEGGVAHVLYAALPEKEARTEPGRADPAGYRQLRLASNAGGTWTVRTLAVLDSFTESIPMAVTDGKERAAAQGFFSDTLHRFTGDGGAWTVEVAGAPGVSRRCLRTAVDGAGKAHFLYWDERRNTLVHTTGDASEDVATAAHMAFEERKEYDHYRQDQRCGADFATSPAGAVVASFGDEAGLKLATRTAAGWTTEVAAAGVDAAFTSLAYDADGQPAVAYFNLEAGRVELARKAAGAWSAAGVGDFGAASFYGDTELVFDTEGVAHVFYTSADPLDRKPHRHQRGRLMHASAKAGSWETLKLADLVVIPSHRFLAATAGAGGETHLLFGGPTAYFFSTRKGMWTSGRVDAFDVSLAAWPSMFVDAWGNARFLYSGESAVWQGVVPKGWFAAHPYEEAPLGIEF